MPAPAHPNRDYLTPVRSHLDRIIDSGLADFGPDPNAMWMASLDVRTGRYPEDDSRPPHIGKRVYRNIDAPRGCSLYWDQPALVACHHLSRITGDDTYAQAADAYVRDFLARCVAGNGLFWWGNHYYYDAFRGEVLWFKGEEPPVPVDRERDEATYYETRPIPPAWQLFWRLDPQATERCIRRMGERHLFDAESGGFNRHADGRRSHAFIESGGILAESLCWLARQVNDPALVTLAQRIAGYSWRHRGLETDLVENNPTSNRWDNFVCTTEVGLWAGSLLRAADWANEPAFVEMAAAAVRAYLRYGYDGDAGRYYGSLRVADGTPALGDRTTPYQPGDYAELWNPLFPSHDYPMALAESCLRLYERTGGAEYEEALHRWLQIVAAALPANGGQGAYAEHYGRCLHFLAGASQLLADSSVLDLARRLADEAVAVLYRQGMFRSHPGEFRYDAVDGAGYLMLALLYLETNQPPDLMGFGF
jgi:hypothetical protein